MFALKWYQGICMRKSTCLFLSSFIVAKKKYRIASRETSDLLLKKDEEKAMKIDTYSSHILTKFSV
jgi:hypothetical protein